MIQVIIIPNLPNVPKSLTLQFQTRPRCAAADSSGPGSKLVSIVVAVADAESASPIFDSVVVRWCRLLGRLRIADDANELFRGHRLWFLWKLDVIVVN